MIIINYLPDEFFDIINFNYRFYAPPLVRISIMATTLKIALLYDSLNKGNADIYARLFRHTPFAHHGLRRLIFDPERIGRTARALERYDVVLAALGIPGRQDYKESLKAFLDAYASAKQKPAVGLVSYEPDASSLIINEWLNP